jgi:tRNA U34 5-carboxymethylaminomethyl modifying GTPase MnmE/TrmE
VYLKKIDVAVIVTDGMSKQAIQKLNEWITLVRKGNMSEIRPSFVILRNKCDLTSQENLDRETGLLSPIQRSCHGDVFRVSARTGQGIPEFLDGLRGILKDRKENPPPLGVEIYAHQGQERKKCGC